MFSAYFTDALFFALSPLFALIFHRISDAIGVWWMQKHKIGKNTVERDALKTQLNICRFSLTLSLARIMPQMH